MEYIEKDGVKYVKVECGNAMKHKMHKMDDMMAVIAENNDHELWFKSRKRAAYYFKLNAGTIKNYANKNMKTKEGYILRNASYEEKGFEYNNKLRAFARNKVSH